VAAAAQENVGGIGDTGRFMAKVRKKAGQLLAA